MIECPNCQAPHSVPFKNARWFVCPNCQHLCQFDQNAWVDKGDSVTLIPNSRFRLGQTGILRERAFTIVGCVQYCSFGDPEDTWYEWVLAFSDQSDLILVDEPDEPLRFYAQRRTILHTIPDFETLIEGQSVLIESYQIEVYEKHIALVVAFAGFVPDYEPPGFVENYFDGIYNQYIVGVTYETAPMICFGLELAETDLVIDN